MASSHVLWLLTAAATSGLTVQLVLDRRALQETRRRLHAAEAENTYLRAQTDSVTGLLPRAQWTVEARERLTRMANPAVVFLDVNKLKVVNDTYSHHDGDQLLREVATRFRAQLGPGAVVGRLGGDEMVAVVDLPDQWHSHFEAVAGACAVEMFGVLCGAALGVARPLDVTRRDTGDLDPHPQATKAVAEQLDRVMHAADLALREAKDYCHEHDVATAVRFYGPQHADVPAELEPHPHGRIRDGASPAAAPRRR